MNIRRIDRRVARGASLLALSALLAVPLAGHLVGASSHREAPLISQDPAADITDTFSVPCGNR